MSQSNPGVTGTSLNMADDKVIMGFIDCGSWLDMTIYGQYGLVRNIYHLLPISSYIVYDYGNMGHIEIRQCIL